MSPDPLEPVWARLDTEPPVFFADRPGPPSADDRSRLLALGVLREIEPARVAVCLACGGGHVRKVQWVGGTPSGSRRARLPCPNCGPVEVDPNGLRRWAVDVPRLLAVVLGAAGGRPAPSELVAGRLWFVGTVSWLGRRRETYFVRFAHGHDRAAVVVALRARPRAVLFHPTEHARQLWGATTPNPAVALASAVRLGPAGATFDTSDVEERLADASPARTEAPVPKRATRAANIERLTEEVIEHLRRARDHAFSTRDITGEPQLLERPTKKHLGELAELDPYEVTRCFKDDSARELNLYWATAADLDAVMRFHKPGG